MKTALEAPQVMKLRDDPTAVFVVLGYADPRATAEEPESLAKRADPW